MSLSELSPLAYPATVIFGGLFLTWLVRTLLNKAEDVRKRRVGSLTEFVAVKTASDKLNTSASSRERGLESIETRFAIMRRLITPLMMVIVVVIAVFPYLGQVPTAVVTLLITIMAAVFGIAAKPVLENAIAGTIISFGQPIRIGDLVMIDDYYGLIEEINLTHTVLKVWDWKRLVVPNSKLLQMEYQNYTLIDKWQWAYVEFWVAYGTDIDMVEALAREAVTTSEHLSHVHPPGFWIVGLDKDAIKCWVAGWVDHPLEAWALRTDISRGLLKGFHRHGIRCHLLEHHFGTGACMEPSEPGSDKGPY